MERHQPISALLLDLGPRLCSGRLELSLCPSGRRPLEMENVVVEVSEEEEEEASQEEARRVHLCSSRVVAREVSFRWAHWLSLGAAAAVAATAAAAADFAAAALNSSFDGWLELVGGFWDPDDDPEEEVMAE